MKEEGKNTERGTPGKTIITLILLVFLGIGLFFTYSMFHEIYKNGITYTWNKEECEIIFSELKESSSGYTFFCRYLVNDSNKDYHFESPSYREANMLFERYKNGQKAFCYVNPYDQNQSTLRPGRVNYMLIIFLPGALLFVLIGSVGIYFIWAGKTIQKDEKKDTPLSKIKKDSSRAVVIVFIFFALIGGVILSFFIRLIMKSMEAETWQETPATVISGRLIEHRDDEGSSYSLDLIYSYEFNGKEYRSNDYEFNPLSNGPHSGKKNIIDSNPPGKKIICYVNPSDPTEAVVKRGLNSSFLVGIIPLLFFLIGLSGIYKTFFPSPAEGGVSPVEYRENARLKPAGSPVRRFIGMLICALIWNGLIFIPVYSMIKNRNSLDLCFSVFMLLFIAVGIFLAGSALYYFLTIFNPVPKITLSSNPLVCGEKVWLEWQVSGNAGSIRKFYITLFGREEVTYTKGSSTSTDKNVFLTHHIIDTTDPYEIKSGKRTFTIPEDTIHTFKSKHNKIIWIINVIGEIQYWPDIKEEYEVTLLPAKVIKGGNYV